MKDRVLSANEQWHKLYKRVVEVFEAIKNILQMWEDFQQLKEHLLLFLTETDVKLTEMESFPQDVSVKDTVCKNIKVGKKIKIIFFKCLYFFITLYIDCNKIFYANTF